MDIVKVLTVVTVPCTAFTYTKLIFVAHIPPYVMTKYEMLCHFVSQCILNVRMEGGDVHQLEDELKTLS